MVAAAVLAATTATSPVGASPADPDPAEVCAVAGQYAAAGLLAEAKALYGQVADSNQTGCQVDGAAQIRARELGATQAVAIGQHLLQAGDVERARVEFQEALDLDRANAGAVDGLAVVEARRRNQRLSSAVPRWNLFYDDWFVPLTRLIVIALATLAIVLAVSGLTTRLVVKPNSIAWSRRARWSIGLPGVLLLGGAAVMLPLYPMFNPFPASDLPGWEPVLGMLVVFPPLVCLAAVRAYRRDRIKDVLSRTELWRRSLGPWSRLLVALLCTGLLGLVFSLLLDQAPERLLTAYAVLTVDGVVLTAAALGQNLRLQVAVQSSTNPPADPVDTDYLLARLQSLGTEQFPQRFPSTNGSSPSGAPLAAALKSEELSALPSGKTVGALSSLFFALRPELTWRARASLVDDSRVAITLSRNGLHADSAIFSRRDLGLPDLRDDDDVKRAKAQLLTGAAAFILVRLSKSHPQLKAGLYGAQDWRSVTLQVIAASNSLIDDNKEKTALFARAVNLDPGNVLARLNHLWTIQDATPLKSPAYAALAEDVDKQLPDVESSGSEVLQIRALYRSAARWINLFVEGGRSDTYHLRQATTRLEALEKACCSYPDPMAKPDLAALIERTRPTVAAMRLDIDLLDRPAGTRRSPADTARLSPRLAYEYACLASLPPTPSRGRALRYLRLALPSKSEKTDAWNDPCLRPLRADREFQQLTDHVPPAAFLDLPAFAAHQQELIDAGLSSPTDLIRCTSTAGQRAALAAHLHTSPFVVGRYRRIAQLARLHPELANAAVLGLLVDCDIDSPTRLRSEVQRDFAALLDDLKRRADNAGVDLPADPHWLAAAVRAGGWRSAARTLQHWRHRGAGR
ncbi:hypothetical protein A6A07_15515 [Streptomyces sp. CB03911]|nr:hypothetical protein A6A07_15515 [Streptomyces sp. CB03911]